MSGNFQGNSQCCIVVTLCGSQTVYTFCLKADVFCVKIYCMAFSLILHYEQIVVQIEDYLEYVLV